MKKILTIIGARPQIIKAAAFSRAVAKRYGDIEEHILHTGQHYDTNMSQVFFDELGIPSPKYNLGVGSGSHGVQTAAMIGGIEKVLMDGAYDGMVLYGDTNSTLAGAVAASKIHVPVFHIEAGLRSFNMSMPEEIDRIVCDQLSSILFAPTQTAVKNLEREGFNSDGDKARFADGKGRKVVLSGDVMLDNSMYFADIADSKSKILYDLGLEERGYILATIHRPANTDNPDNLSSIFEALLEIDEKVVLPLHPRTRNLLQSNLPSDLYMKVMGSEKLKLIPPASFFDIIVLEKHASVIMTDSGGVQKEAFFYGRPTIILRPETEWVEIVDYGAGVLTDSSKERILSAYSLFAGKKIEFPPLFGDGKASEKIVEEIIKY